MKRLQTPCLVISIVLFSILHVACAQYTAKNALATVRNLLGKLETRVVNDGKKEAKAYADVRYFCAESKTASREQLDVSVRARDQAQGRIDEATAGIMNADAQIEEFSDSIASDQADLKTASEEREQEAENFRAAEKDLSGTIRSCRGALTYIVNHAKRNPNSLAQVDTDNFETLMDTLNMTMDAVSIASSDKQRLVALIQSSGKQAQDDQELIDAESSPKERNRIIVDLIEDLKAKAELQLRDLRYAETDRDNAHKLAAQTRKNAIFQNTNDMKHARFERDMLDKQKAKAEHDLSKIMTTLKAEQKTMDDLTLDCSQKIEDYETYMRNQEDELTAIRKAKGLIRDAVDPAEIQTGDSQSDDSSDSFIQVQRHQIMAKSKAILFVRQLARKFHSGEFAQLASRMKAIMRYGPEKQGRLTKVKGLLDDLLKKMKRELADAIAEKTWCDQGLRKNKLKMNSLKYSLGRMNVDKEGYQSELRDMEFEEKHLLRETADEIKRMEESTAIFEEEKENFEEIKKDLQDALRATRNAIGELNKYYGQVPAAASSPDTKPDTTSSTSAGQGIVRMMGVVADDIANRFAKEEKSFQSAKMHYEQEADDFKFSQLAKKRNAEYLHMTILQQHRLVAASKQDMFSKNAELNAMKGFDAKLRDRCFAKKETWDDLAARREQEIKGLKEAFEILEAEYPSEKFRLRKKSTQTW